MSEALKRLIELGEKLPKGLRSDWDATNHYELQSSEEDDFWWLILSYLFRPEHGYPKDEIPCETEYGKRVGLIMDIAVALQQALPDLKKEENVKS